MSLLYCIAYYDAVSVGKMGRVGVGVLSLSLSLSRARALSLTNAPNYMRHMLLKRQ